ncbi:MAG: hypothetical protein ACUVX9_07235 [Anaerolineae bacterium]
MRNVRSVVTVVICLVLVVMLGCKQAGSRVAQLTPTAATASTQERLGEGTATAVPRQTGMVVGRLLERGTAQPIADEPVLLAVIGGTQDFPVAELERAFAPQCVTGPDGVFSIADVAPGRYVLVVGHEGTGGMVEDEGTGQTLLVSVGPGQTADLGTINISRPQ